MTKDAIFIAATGQNVGKTTICLGVIAALQKRIGKVGFIKPVGQHHVKVENDISVDKDAYLFKKYFDLDSPWPSTSPVIIPAGFTRRFLDGEFSSEHMLDNIKRSFQEISSEHAFTVVEGTGHVGVGSIVNLSNARVASELGLDMVIIASAGLGSTHDELAINIAMCEKFGVKIRGIILNRVAQSKKEMIEKYFPISLDKWNVPLIGSVPYDPFLSKPTVKDFEVLFNNTLTSGEPHRLRHFESVRLFAGSVNAYRKEIEPNQLVITPASREDIILATLEKHKEMAESGLDFQGGMILTGRHSPGKEIQDEIRRVDIPILYAPITSYDAMKKITSFIAKIRLEDVMKIEKAIHLVENNVNFDALCGPRLHIG
ncbi:MAG: AAA family ATPase [Chlamydiota bacterium]|nr:AAA family ATPase [Chlamydiota bacterium]